MVHHAAAGTVLLLLSGSGAVAIDEGTPERCAAAYEAITKLVYAKGTICFEEKPCEPLSGLKLYAHCITGKVLNKEGKNAKDK